MLLPTTDNFISCNQTHHYHPQFCTHIKQRWVTCGPCDHWIVPVTVDNTKNFPCYCLAGQPPKGLPVQREHVKEGASTFGKLVWKLNRPTPVSAMSSEYKGGLTRCLGLVRNQAPHKVRMGAPQVSHQLVQVFLWWNETKASASRYKAFAFLFKFREL